MGQSSEDPRSGRVPPQALLLSLLSLGVPVASSSFFPEWTNEDMGLLVWLLALIPSFVLSYYRGWRGAWLALAGGMLAFAGAQVVVAAVGGLLPPPEMVTAIILVLIAGSLGSGFLSSLFHRVMGPGEQMALRDPATGLANRRQGLRHLQRAFAAAERGSALTVVMFDLDNFKSVNDDFGHQAGDEALRVFGEILQRHTHPMHLSVRFDGMEFMALLDDFGADGARIMAEKVREAVRSHTFSWGQLTVSAGVASYEDGMPSPDFLIGAADAALYLAKARGGDQVVTITRHAEGVPPA